MTGQVQRICSLLPSATEIVCVLGLSDRLVAVTHECDHPEEAATKPRVTSSVIDSDGLSAREIDQAVRDSLAEEASIYHLDQNLLNQLGPDLILTQDLCDVCAVGSGIVHEVAATLPGNPRVVSLEPRTLGQVLDSILAVGRLTGTLQRAIEVVDALRARLEVVRRAVAGQPRVPVLTLEWIDPVFVGGHWVPEMVEIAGGRDVLGRVGEPSHEATWEEVAAAAPEITVAMPCGFDLVRSASALSSEDLPTAWRQLLTAHADQIYVVDGSSYFNRPGPRLVDGVEILASILHPEVFSQAPTDSFARWADLQRQHV